MSKKVVRAGHVVADVSVKGTSESVPVLKQWPVMVPKMPTSKFSTATPTMPTLVSATKAAATAPRRFPGSKGDGRDPVVVPGYPSYGETIAELMKLNSEDPTNLPAGPGFRDKKK